MTLVNNNLSVPLEDPTSRKDMGGMPIPLPPAHVAISIEAKSKPGGSTVTCLGPSVPALTCYEGDMKVLHILVPLPNAEAAWTTEKEPNAGQKILRILSSLIGADDTLTPQIDYSTN
ncbi:hypothetical protein AMTR_s00056p00202920 [Amborella trichopoda]|uniref:Uncharacterized protein n=1 Tax=Amborella trichopoda TaxID=13333 RepID=U5CZ37_AMBTC|nr:hypothetical protein AMTR_s00056p00202920 [Amborella trichopoda]